jgi:glycosyltransferase involved in cell wall biosynthesis
MPSDTFIQSLISPQRSQLSFHPQFLEQLNPKSEKIAILATNEFEGFSKNGGIGTYYTALSEKLAGENWLIILLLCQSEEPFQGVSKTPNVDRVFSAGEVATILQLQPIHEAILAHTQENGVSQSFDADSFCCLFFTQAIATTFPQAVIYVEFPVIWGFGYRTLQAKRAGLLGNHCLLGVTDHGGFEWLRETNSRYKIDYPQWFWQAYHYEQYSYEQADLTCFPSYFLKSKVEGYGWKTAHAVHLPYFIPLLDLSPQPLAQPDNDKISVIFFGRLEERKGLCSFVEALQLLESDWAKKIEILFLGRIIPLESTALKGLDSQAYIDRQLQGKFSYQILPDLFSQEALELVNHLPHPIVCLCSLQENFPNAALEMGQLPVSLVVSNTGGFQETLDLIARTEGLRWFEPGDAYSLAGRLREAMLAYPETPAAPDRSLLEETNKKLLNQRLELMSEAFLQSAPNPLKTPRITIGVIGNSDRQLLAGCLESLAAQTYDNLEILVADSGVMDERFPEEQFPHARRVELEVNQTLGYGYNHLVKLATGEYFLPFSSDRLALPDMVERWVSIIAQSDAAIVMSPEMKLDPDLEVSNGHDGSLLKLLDLNQNQDLCALFSLEFLREFPYCEVRNVQALNWQLLAAAIATDRTIAYYPYPLYLSGSDAEGRIAPENLPKERYYLRQYLSQIEPEKWTRRQLNLLLTGVEQLSQLQSSQSSQLWQVHQEKTRYQALASQSQAWMQTAIETQKELEALQAQLQNNQAMR